MKESNLVQNKSLLNRLPKTWLVKNFKDVVIDNSGGNRKLAKADFLEKGEIAVVDQGKHLIAGYYNNLDFAVKTRPPYVIFGDHTRIFKFIDFPFIMGADGTKVLQPINENCDTKYLYYFFLSINVPETGYNRHFKYLKELKIPLPPLEQQKKIAAILDEADAYRQKTKALIAKYDELTQSLFLDMFGDPVKNEKGWEVNNLKNMSIKIHSGNTPKGGSEVYVEQGITFFRSQNVWKNRIVYEDIAFIDQATHDKMLKSSLKNRDILITKTGRINTENSSLGRAAMYMGEDDKANVNGHVYFIRLKKGVLNEFVLHILTTKEYRGHIRSVCVGGIDKRQLNKDHIENFPIISPPIESQIKFTGQLAIIETQKAKAQASLEKAEELFNSLLQRAFKGELV